MHLKPWPFFVANLATGAAIGPNPGYGGLHFNFPNVTSPTRFDIHLDQGFLDLSLRKVRDYRPSQTIFPNWTIEGPPSWEMADMADYWSQSYHWRVAERRINEFEHYATTVPGGGNYSAPIPLHFVHQRSNKTNDTPIILLHGWTSTHFEWSRVIEPLTRQSGNHTFHVVAPDLPGYGFSPAPTEPLMGPREMGAAFDALMGQLGYETYGIVATDLGWAVGMWMLEDFPDRITGLFTDFYRLPVLPSDLSRQAANQTTEEENEFIEVSNAWDLSHSSYATVQAQKPQALSLALTDSPVGFAGWLWDLRYAISDGYSYSYEELITGAMLLWIQSPYGSMRSWLEFQKPEALILPRTNVPIGITLWGNTNGPFPSLANFPLVPRRWAERTARVTYWNRYEFGGHYPFLTQPQLWLDNVRAFFADV